MSGTGAKGPKSSGGRGCPESLDMGLEAGDGPEPAKGAP